MRDAWILAAAAWLAVGGFVTLAIGLAVLRDERRARIERLERHIRERLNPRAWAATRENRGEGRRC